MQIGPYEIVNQADKNATSSVYQVTLNSSSKLYALKLLNKEISADKSFIRDYTSNIQLLSAHLHPQIILPIEINEEMGQYYLVYPWIEGYSLKQIMAEHGALSQNVSLSMTKNILNLLSFLHQKKCFHFNLKPSNIIIESKTCKTFLLDIQFTKNITIKSLLEGKLQQVDAHSTLGYMAPEQFYSIAGCIGAHSDIYSLGIILYEMLSGKFPFSDMKDPVEIAHAHIMGDYERLLKYRKDLLPKIEKINQKMMEKEVENRYRSTLEATQELNNIDKYSKDFQKEMENMMGSFFEIVTEDHSFTTSVAAFKKSFDKQFSNTNQKTAPSPPIEINENDIIAERYRIDKLISHTILNKVYLGFDLKEQKKVTVQVPNHLYPSLYIRLENEFQSLKHINHPAFIRLVDLVENNGQCYLVREYIEGEPIKSIINSKIVSIEKSIRIVLGVLDGLHYLHQQNIIHKEFNSDNILVTSDLQVKIISLAANQLEDASSINSGDFIENAQYISPEQISQSKSNVCTDIYLAGILLFELITGKPPFVSSSPIEIMDMHLRKTPRFPEKIQPFVPINLQMIIKKSLEKAPADRFSSAREFYESLNDFLISYANVICNYKSHQNNGTKKSPPPKSKKKDILSKNKSLTTEKKIIKNKNAPAKEPIGSTEDDHIEIIKPGFFSSKHNKEDFLFWFESLFQLIDTPAPPFNTSLSAYDLHFAPTPLITENYLKEKIQQGHTARLTSGLCWKWSDKLDSQGQLFNDIIINKYTRPWIVHPNIQHPPANIPVASSWAHDPNGFDQIGHIHAVNNVELDYIGVIIGKDLVFDKQKNCWKINAKHCKDPHLTKAKKDRLEAIKRNYLSLMRLGNKGCILCFLDPNTRSYIQSNIVT